MSDEKLYAIKYTGKGKDNGKLLRVKRIPKGEAMFGIIPKNAGTDPNEGEWELTLEEDYEVWVIDSIDHARQTAGQVGSSFWNPKHQPVNPYYRTCKVVEVKQKDKS